MRYQAKAFRCLARFGCCVVEHVLEKHRDVDDRVHVLLEQPELAERADLIPPCMLVPNSFTGHFVNDHPELKGDAVEMKLTCSAIARSYSTRIVERFHSMVRLGHMHIRWWRLTVHDDAVVPI